MHVVYAVYVRAVISESTQCAQALLLLVLQATLCSQDLAAGGDEFYPVFELLGELWALDLHMKKKGRRKSQSGIIMI